MRITLLGINHRTAPVEVRERVALQGDKLADMVDRFRVNQPYAELVVLCTCNRMEIYAAHPTGCRENKVVMADELRSLVAAVTNVALDQLTPITIHRENEQAIGHLFRVASGLDSMVLGEQQILGQIKRAYDDANARHCVGPVLHGVFQQAIASGKLVRNQTQIDAGRMSVGSVAVQFARQIFEVFEDKTVVGIGAGELAKVTLEHLINLNPARLWVTNRTMERAQELAGALGLAGEGRGVRHFDDLDNLLVEADIIVSATSSPDPIITEARFRPLIKRRRSRPLFLIDIAVPRDIEQAVGTMPNVYLYNIDDLQQVVARTCSDRSEKVAAAEHLVAEQVRLCMSQLRHRDVGRLIKALRQRLHEIGDSEHERTLRKLRSAGSGEAEEILQEHTNRLINKVLHMPLSQLDGRDPDAPLGFYAAALRRLFNLDDVADADHQSPSPPEVSPEVSPDISPQAAPEASPQRTING